MVKAIGYIRVSTEEQKRKGISVEAQEATLRSYAAMRQIELVDVVRDEGISAGKLLEKRKGGRQVLKAIDDRQVEAVVAFKLDRLFRNTVECLTRVTEWDKAGVGLHLIDLGGQTIDTQSAMGRFFLTMMAGIAELERSMTGERVSAVRKHLRKTGRFGGGRVPYGLRVDGRFLVNDPEEQSMIRAAKQLRNKGTGLRRIGHILTDRGYDPRSGGEWSAEQVKCLLAAG